MRSSEALRVSDSEIGAHFFHARKFTRERYQESWIHKKGGKTMRDEIFGTSVLR